MIFENSNSDFENPKFRFSSFLKISLTIGFLISRDRFQSCDMVAKRIEAKFEAKRMGVLWL